MKKINLLPWREQEKKLKIKRFFVIWVGVSCSCFSLLIIYSIAVTKQIKDYQLISNRIILQLKTLSNKIQKIKKLQYEERELIKIIKITKINHYQLNKISNFLTHLKYLTNPDIFINLIEYYPPYFILILHVNSEKNYLRLIKNVKIRFNYKLKSIILNRSKYNSTLDFLIKMKIS